MVFSSKVYNGNSDPQEVGYIYYDAHSLPAPLNATINAGGFAWPAFGNAHGALELELNSCGTPNPSITIENNNFQGWFNIVSPDKNLLLTKNAKLFDNGTLGSFEKSTVYSSTTALPTTFYHELSNKC